LSRFLQNPRQPFEIVSHTISTCVQLLTTHFPSVRFKPLSHFSKNTSVPNYWNN